MSRRGPGRPVKPKGEKLDALLPVRMLEAEKDELIAYAATQGLSASDYLRRAAAYCRALGVPLARVTVGPLPPGIVVE